MECYKVTCSMEKNKELKAVGVVCNLKEGLAEDTFKKRLEGQGLEKMTVMDF